MPKFDYSCKCGEVKKDHIVKKYDAEVKCPKCDRTMKKDLSVPHLGGMNKQGSSTGAGLPDTSIDGIF